MNELKILFDRMGINIWEVIDAPRQSHRFQPFYPGPGLGGHCIPLDPVLSLMEAMNVSTKFIELAGRLIRTAGLCGLKVMKALNDVGKPMKVKILILGLAYKANVDDDRNLHHTDLSKSLRNLAPRWATTILTFLLYENQLRHGMRKNL